MREAMAGVCSIRLLRSRVSRGLLPRSSRVSQRRASRVVLRRSRDSRQPSLRRSRDSREPFRLRSPGSLGVRLHSRGNPASPDSPAIPCPLLPRTSSHPPLPRRGDSRDSRRPRFLLRSRDSPVMSRRRSPDSRGTCRGSPEKRRRLSPGSPAMCCLLLLRNQGSLVMCRGNPEMRRRLLSLDSRGLPKCRAPCRPLSRGSRATCRPRSRGNRDTFRERQDSLELPECPEPFRRRSRVSRATFLERRARRRLSALRACRVNRASPASLPSRGSRATFLERRAHRRRPSALRACPDSREMEQTPHSTRAWGPSS
mmetsp:Transcript_49384/g.148759  ORF Transcript_49384/g.148759 Transcript_49384/m.148759 type:complete len:313 (+) Transcript_49384:796-1734(+)